MDQVGIDPGDQPGPEAPFSPWVVTIAVAAAALVGYVIVFGFVIARTGTPQTDSAAPATTSPPLTVAPTTTPTAPTLAPTSTQQPTSTTEAPTTTVASATTVPPSTTLPELAAAGDPIPMEELEMGAFRLGPLPFDDAEAAAQERLVATLGQPDHYEPAGEEWGLCPGDEGRVLHWAGFTAIFRVLGDAEALVGFQLAQRDAEAEPHPTDGLRTLSGVGLGTTNQELRLAYAVVQTEGGADEPSFYVLRSTDARTLLWGETDAPGPQGRVTVIRSPRPCDGGPTRSL